MGCYPMSKLAPVEEIFDVKVEAIFGHDGHSIYHSLNPTWWSRKVAKKRVSSIVGDAHTQGVVSLPYVLR